MPGRKRRKLTDRVAVTPPGTVDKYAAGALILGMTNWLTLSLFNFDAVQAIAGRKSISGRTAYGLIGLSALYATVRGTRRTT